MKTTRLLLCALALAFAFACGPKPDETKCTPNFSGPGMSVRAEYLRDNSDGSAAYLIKLCEDSNPSPVVFSVYGATASDTEVYDTESQVRFRNVSESSHAGAQFEVSFRSHDTKFFIYQDRAVPGTGYELDTTVVMVSGLLSQALYAGSDP